MVLAGLNNVRVFIQDTKSDVYVVHTGAYQGTNFKKKSTTGRVEIEICGVIGGNLFVKYISRKSTKVLSVNNSKSKRYT